MNTEEKIVFAVGETDDKTLVIIIGVSDASIEHMRSGKSHNVDFTKVGLPIQMMMFYGKTNEDIIKQIVQANDAAKVDLKSDFGIKMPTEN